MAQDAAKFKECWRAILMPVEYPVSVAKKNETTDYGWRGFIWPKESASGAKALTLISRIHTDSGLS